MVSRRSTKARVRFWTWSNANSSAHCLLNFFEGNLQASLCFLGSKCSTSTGNRLLLLLFRHFNQRHYRYCPHNHRSSQSECSNSWNVLLRDLTSHSKKWTYHRSVVNACCPWRYCIFQQNHSATLWRHPFRRRSAHEWVCAHWRVSPSSQKSWTSLKLT